MFTQQELQQLKSILKEKIDDLEAHRSIYKEVIAQNVEYKKPFVASGQKDVVDYINDAIREDYKEVDKTDKKLKKLRALQRRVKESMVDVTIIARYELADDGRLPSSYHDDDFVEVLPEPNEALVDAMDRFRASSHAGYVETTLGDPIECKLMSSNEGWQDNKMENFWKPPKYDLPVGVTIQTLPYITNTTNPTLDPTSKPSNPKDAIGSDKLPIHLWPNTATAMGCLGFLNGAAKYGRSNFRAIGIRASIYYDAAKRHLDAWFEGESVDPDDNVPHLSAALACIAIIVDAQAAGKLNDDRAYPGGYRKLVDELTPLVAQIKKHHEAKNPKHYTIADANG